jgi:hypothetical protein
MKKFSQLEYTNQIIPEEPKPEQKQMKFKSHDDAYKPPQKTIGGYNGYQVISALQKCIRRGLEQDALFWARSYWPLVIRRAGNIFGTASGSSPAKMLDWPITTPVSK